MCSPLVHLTEMVGPKANPTNHYFVFSCKRSLVELIYVLTAAFFFFRRTS